MTCFEIKPLTEYYSKSSHGKKYPESFCKKCSIARTMRRKAENPEYYDELRVRSERKKAERQRVERESDLRREHYIVMDCRKSDRKVGFENDLDKPFVKNLISEGCAYCGDRKTRMSLDRMDNSLGHTKANVVPSCVRCNLTRGNMPYSAWLIVAKGMREAFEAGLFQDWAGPRTGRKQ